MTYSNIIERIAYKWERTLMAKGVDGEYPYYKGEISGMISAVAMMECKTPAEVRNDILSYAHKHGRLKKIDII